MEFPILLMIFKYFSKQYLDQSKLIFNEEVTLIHIISFKVMFFICLLKFHLFHPKLKWQ